MTLPQIPFNLIQPARTTGVGSKANTRTGAVPKEGLLPSAPASLFPLARRREGMLMRNSLSTWDQLWKTGREAGLGAGKPPLLLCFVTVVQPLLRRGNDPSRLKGKGGGSTHRCPKYAPQGWIRHKGNNEKRNACKAGGKGKSSSSSG